MHIRVKHALYWLFIFILWTYLKSGGVNYDAALLLNSINLPLFMLTFYLLKHVQLPSLYDRGKTLLFILSFILSTAIITWMFLGLVNQFFDYCKFPYVKLGGFLIEAVQMSTPPLALLGLEYYGDREEEKETIQALEREKVEMELKFLKAQLNPHFLFNTLNNLYSFVITKSSKAPDVVHKLSGMLNYALEKGEEEKVALGEELEVIDHFLGLEHVRYGDRLEVKYSTGGDLTVKVSPLILLSIVENAFKHGASGDIDKPKIDIDIKEKDSKIECSVWNTKSLQAGELNDAYKVGIGLSNIKRQLDLIYANNHNLKIEDLPKSFCVHLTLNEMN